MRSDSPAALASLVEFVCSGLARQKAIGPAEEAAVRAAKDVAGVVAALGESWAHFSRAAAAAKPQLDGAELEALAELEAEASGRGGEKRRPAQRFTENQVAEMEAAGADLYKEIPGTSVPRSSERSYVETQLKRFVDSGGSDFFLETQKADGKIWFRLIFKIDGAQEIQDQSEPRRPEDASDGNDNIFFKRVRKYLGAELSRINADMKHVAQDGSFTLEYRGKARDFRVNALPCRAYGEAHPRYAIRLASVGDNIDFDRIEMLPLTKRLYSSMIHNKIAGCIVVTGPTGSGKTTTIYGMLNKIDKDSNGVISIEKPIESQLRGVNQTEDDVREREDRKDKYGTREFLKSALRQAADVVFVGEMRDDKEIQEGIKVGLTGSKVFTTLHTNNCVDTILRLKEEGVNNGTIAQGVKFITAQRLVPALCPHCAVPHPASPKLLEKIENSFGRPAKHFSAHLAKALESVEISDLLDGDAVREAALRDRKLNISDDDADELFEIVEGARDYLSGLKSKDERVGHILSLCADEFPNRPAMVEFRERLESAHLMSPNRKGCGRCRNGYSGRAGIFEVLKMDRSVRRFIQDPANRLVDLEDFLKEKGFLDMRRYGWLLALGGKLSPDDVAVAVE